MDWLTGLVKYVGVLIAGFGYGVVGLIVMIVIGAMVFILGDAARMQIDEDFPND
jgi:hypothetical protein